MINHSFKHIHSQGVDYDLSSSQVEKGKYVVLRYYRVLNEWNLVRESKCGLTWQDAQTVVRYEQQFGKVDKQNLLIVKVED